MGRYQVWIDGTMAGSQGGGLGGLNVSMIAALILRCANLITAAFLHDCHFGCQDLAIGAKFGVRKIKVQAFQRLDLFLRSFTPCHS